MARKKEFFENDVALQGIYAAGSLGTAGQVLKSDGDSVYWGTDSSSGGDAATPSKIIDTPTKPPVEVPKEIPEPIKPIVAVGPPSTKS